MKEVVGDAVPGDSRDGVAVQDVLGERWPGGWQAVAAESDKARKIARRKARQSGGGAT